MDEKRPEEKRCGFLESETVLPDDYPVHYGYVYIADGRFVRSMLDGDVLRLKEILKAKEVRRCDMFHESRRYMRIGDRV